MQIKEFKEKKDTLSKKLEEINKKSNSISWIRVALFIVAIASFVYGYFIENNLFYIVSILLIIAFLIIVKIHTKIEEEIRYYESENDINDKYIKRIESTWYDFEEDGSEYLEDDMPHLKDLDIFGKGSLYQYICSANSIYGKDYLVKHLKNTDYNLDEILEYQEAVKELSTIKEFSDKIQILSNLINNNKRKDINKEIEKFLDVCEQKASKTNPIIKVLMYLLPATFISVVVLFLLGINKETNIDIAKIILIINLLISNVYIAKNTSILAPIGDFYKNIKVYRKIFEEIENRDFKSKYLKELKSNLNKKGGSLKSLDRLNKIGECINIRQNFIGNVLLNGFLLWDFQCVDMFNKWKQDYKVEMRDYLKSVGKLEAIISLATITYIRDDYTFPQLNDLKTPKVEFKNIKHPLINMENVVGNSIDLNSQTCIITGSNMSGKTTFLRSIGSNLVLAYAGGAVLAEEFNTSIMRILTSIRVEDNVNKGISTFYAELLRIKQMTDYNNNKQPMICLIDEIFKGTNSADRIICATESIKKLSNPWSITIVSTHDFELCRLEDDKNINAINYHFSEYYKDNQIYFDYNIKHGQCVTTNAKILLKMVGIVDEI